MLDKQTIFDETVKHLVAQGKPALMIRHNGVSQCFYRATEEGEPTLMCAFGVWIPEAIYRADMECRGARELFLNYPALKALYGDHESTFNRLQRAHDNWGTGYCAITWENFTTEFTNAAKDLEVDPIILTKLIPNGKPIL